MGEILDQLAGLFLRAIPTGVILLLTWAAYRWLVHGKLVDVLAERRARTEGAMEKARADVADAEARTADYEQRIRDARLSLYKAQEARRRQQLDARAAVVAEARAVADARVRAAREALENDAAAARSRLQGEAEELASEIIRTILKPARAAEYPVAGGSQ
jgi:F-type H+-transporting ATPase subunit b